MSEFIIGLTESKKAFPKFSFYKYEIGGVVMDTQHPDMAYRFNNIQGAKIVADFIEANYDYYAQLFVKDEMVRKQSN